MLPEPARRRNRGARTAGAKAGKSEDEGGRGDGLVGEGERAEDLRDEGLGLGAGARVEGREGLALLDALADLAQARDADGRVDRVRHGPAAAAQQQHGAADAVRVDAGERPAARLILLQYQDLPFLRICDAV